MELVIEKLVYGGDGLARLPEQDRRRQAVFVPFVLPGERVEASIVEERPGFARAHLERVLEPSPARIAAACPYFGECGGCRYQHIAYREQLAIKAEILRETVARIGKVELPEIQMHHAQPWSYRNRTRLRVRTFPEVNLAYRRLRSHDLLAVRTCPISCELINRAIASISTLKSNALPENAIEIELFADGDDRQLLLQVFVAKGKPDAAGVFQELRDRVPELIGVTAARRTWANSDLSSVAAPELSPDRQSAGTIAVAGKEALTYKLGASQYRVATGSFFQTNRFLVSALMELATDGAEGRLAWDLYAGVGLFTLPLATRFERVVAVEGAPRSYSDLRHNAPPQVKAVEASVEHFVQQAGRKRPDFVIVDPPRAGLGPRVSRALASVAPPRIAYVSCDPSTLARDLAVFTAAGYRIQRAHMVDLFPQTSHIETVLQLAR